MILEEAQKLLTSKQQSDNANKSYEDQRLIVYNIMVNENLKYYEIDGYKIIREEDSTSLIFNKQLLSDELKAHGFSAEDIFRIFARSKRKDPKRVL